MKINFDAKKGAEAVNSMLAKATDIGKKSVEEVQKNAAVISEKAKQDSYQRRLKKYNPLFPDVYHSSNFIFPKLIVVVDDVVRKDIDVCEGAVGWLGSENNMEILYLYTDVAASSTIEFIPSLDSDAAYYLDNFNPNRYIRTDCIFNKAHDERMAELKHIAYSLGAKSCTIEISESIAEVSMSSKKLGFGSNIPSSVKIAVKASSEQSNSHKESFNRSGRITAQFEGNSVPTYPSLKWFAQDETVKHLIDMRCNSGNALKSEVLELYGSSSATMSQKAAVAIDGAVSKIGIKTNSAMEQQATRESTSKLIFSIEF